MPSAATSSVRDSGSNLTPVSIADRPSATERKSGTTKKNPACTRNWKKNIVSPPVSCRLRSIAGRTRGSSPRDSRRACHWKKSQITNSPASTSHTVGERPAQDGSAGPGLDPAPLAGAQDAEDEQPEAERGEHRTDHVELRPLLHRRVRDPAGEEQDDEHDEHLAREHPAP